MSNGDIPESKLTDAETWANECMHFYGRVLTGRHGHYCPDWDYLPLDETCPDVYAHCHCDKDSIAP
jgi:hypothetical protein